MHSGLEAPIYGLGCCLVRWCEPVRKLPLYCTSLVNVSKGSTPIVAIPPHEAFPFCAWSSKACCGSGTSHNPQPRQHSPHVSSLASSI